MKLKVLAGAKQGAEIPLKKAKFVIGRASDCTLRAGSDAISRHHCVVITRESGVSVRDLGSRNGTHVNGERIEKETPLKNGDRVRVGPLEFALDMGAELSREKKPKVKDVAEAVDRAAASSNSATIEEDDISAWLIGPDPASKAMHETQNFRMDDTHAIGKAAANTVDEADIEAEAEAAEAEVAEADASDSKAGKGKKPQPGKLPKLPPKPQSKDSCEAAADILRELARRR